MDLESFLSRERERVEEALERAVRPEPEDGAVVDAMRYAVRAGGKRIRPVICVAAYRAVAGATPPAVYRLSAALELVHTYSLVHDDLPSMDDDRMRRGRASTHVAHGVATATLAGAAMIPLAVKEAAEAVAVLSDDEDRARDVVGVLCRAAGGGGMVGGQALDLEAERRSISLDELERIHRLKTGALLAAAPVMGGVAAGAEPAQVDALVVYGRALGLAFQITDDILDVTASSEVLGKTAGRDTDLGKATFPGIAGLDESRRRARGEMETAQAALDAAGLDSAELRALARYAVERDR